MPSPGLFLLEGRRCSKINDYGRVANFGTVSQDFVIAPDDEVSRLSDSQFDLTGHAIRIILENQVSRVPSR